MFHIAVTDKPFEYFEKSIREEDLLSRAFDFTNIGTMTENILGASPRYSISDWESEKVSERFPIRRDFPWNHGLQIPEPIVSIEVEKKLAALERAKEPPSLDEMKHKDQKVFSIIEPILWNKAGWQGTLFITEPTYHMPPWLCVFFKNADAGMQIFENWRKEIGREDLSEKIQVSIIRGIDRLNPAHYAVFIGINNKVLITEPVGKRFVMVSRFHRMSPNDTLNLDRFLDNYEHVKTYLLAPANASDPYSKPTIHHKLGILKKQLRVIEAWQLSENDMEICVVEDADNVTVPEGVTDVSVRHALKKLSERMKKIKP